MDTLLPSQPSTYKQLVKTSLHLYRASFSRIILLSFLLAILVFIPRLLSAFIGDDVANLHPYSPNRIWMFVVNLIGITFFIGIVWRMNCVIRGIHEPLIEDLTVGLKKVMYVFFASILQGIIVFAITMALFELQRFLIYYHVLFSDHLIGVAFVACIFVGQCILIVYVSTLFIFFIPLIAIENRGVIRSLERSILLVWNHWWRVFSVQLTPWICYTLLLFLIRCAFRISIHIDFVEHGPYGIETTIAHTMIFALFIPWVAAILLTQLKDLELRKKMTT